MKMNAAMEKTAVLLLAAMLLCGCSSEGTVKNTSDEASEETIAGASEETTADTAESTADAAGSTADTATVTKLLGTIEDTVYKNTFFSFQFTLLSDCVFSDETALKEANSYDDGTSFAEQAAASLSTAGGDVLVMEAREDGSAAYDGVDNVSVSVIYSDEEITDDLYKNIVSDAVNTVKSQYASDATASAEETEFTIAGVSRQGISFTAEKDGIQVYEDLIYIPNGQYLAEITIGTLDKSRLEEILQQFTE